MKGVLSHKESSVYKDRIEERYHFPNRYLGAARQLVGDWFVYHEPGSDGGRKAYIAVAHLDRISPDPEQENHSYAHISGFMPFDTPVPIHGNGRYFETAANTSTSIFQRAAMRPISDSDFTAIVKAGLREIFDPENHRLLDIDTAVLDEEACGFFDNPQTAFERPIEQILLNRPLRDAAFRHSVRSAYDFTCAVTGLKMRNGGGRPEVQAAHIWAVADGGPDSVSNGLALSQTAHWMFDRGLIGIRDDYSLIVSHNQVPGPMRHLFGERETRIHLPQDPRHRPNPFYLAKHRERFCL